MLFSEIFDFGRIVQMNCWIYSHFDEVFIVFSHGSCHSVGGGNLPLQGDRLFVMIAILRSRGESMIRAPVTPTALQPYPIQVVSACFPHAPQDLKHGSRLKATLGRAPKSSSIAKRGKNIAIGGSITATTQSSTRRTPLTTRLIII